MKLVFDTNVFISGLFWKGPSYRLLLLCNQRKFILVTSFEIITELRKVLKAFKISLPDDEINYFLKKVMMNSLIVKPRQRVRIVKDPDDDKFIEEAFHGKADFIVSQDKHLLDVGNYRGIKIVTPVKFLADYL